MVDICVRALVAALAIAVAAGQSTAASAKDKPVGTEAPTARVTVSKGYKSGLTVSANQYYRYFETSACDTPLKIALLFPLSGKSKTKSLPAGKRIILHAENIYFYTSGVGSVGGSPYATVSNITCLSRASFIPTVGGEYDVVQTVPFGGSCSFSIIDKATGLAPESLRSDPTGAECASLLDEEPEPAPAG